MTRAILAAAAAAVAAALLAIPEIFGVETWKWVLGVAGLVLFLAGSRDRSRKS